MFIIFIHQQVSESLEDQNLGDLKLEKMEIKMKNFNVWLMSLSEN